jgi:two-component system, NarL family, sensor kinase
VNRAPAERRAVWGAVADVLAGRTELAAALDGALSVVCERLDLETGWIWLYDDAAQSFYLAAARNLPPYLQEPVQMTGDACWCMESFDAGDFVSENVDVIECSRLRKAHRTGDDALTGGLRYHASVVLRFAGRQLGIMNLTTRNWKPLDDDALAVLSTVGHQVGLAVERGRLADETSALARADERTRMAREIHDTLAQDLTAISLQLEGALRRLPGEGEPHERVERALDVARDSLRRARESVLNLRSDPLDGKPLAAALAALTRRFTSRTGIVATLFADPAPRLTHANEVELYRVAAEALTNVERHAHAHRVELRLRTDGDVTLSIADDGVGYLPAPPDAERYGVVGMQERTRAAGGSFSIERGPDGRGTIVCARIPATSP